MKTSSFCIIFFVVVHGMKILSKHQFFSEEAFSKWNNFVESIKSKLTVKQVVDGVRSGGQLSFDYLLLIVTAE